MIIVTTEGLIEVRDNPNTSLDEVMLTSGDLDTLECVLVNIKLCGASEDKPEGRREDLRIEPMVDGRSRLKMERGTFLNWLMFEGLHYLDYGLDGFAHYAKDQATREIIEKVREVGGVAWKATTK